MKNQNASLFQKELVDEAIKQSFVKLNPRLLFRNPVMFTVEIGTVVMLSVLGLIDVVMIANLLIMVIVGGYETFVSRLNLQGHPDQPEWLSHVNAGILKVKLATALIGISSIHVLKTFISAGKMETKAMLWQVVIHVTFVLSALCLAWIDRLLYKAPENGAASH